MKKQSIIPNIADAKKEQCMLMFLAGMSVAEIAEKAGIKPITCKKWADVGKWAPRRKQLKELQMKLNPTSEKPLAKAVEKMPEYRERFRAATGETAAVNAEFIHKLTPAERLEKAQNIKALNDADRRNLELDQETQGSGGSATLQFLVNPIVKMISDVDGKVVDT